MTSPGRLLAPSVRSSAVWPVLLGVGLLAGATAAALSALSLTDALTATGLPNPGPVTTYGLPFVRAAGEIAAVLAVGSFMFAAFLVPPQTTGVLDAAGYRALRLGTVASGVWTVCAALLVPLTVSDVTGQPVVSRLSPSAIWSVASLVDTASAWRWTAVLAAAVTLASLPVLRWSWTPLLFGGSLVTLVPLALTGHSSAGGSHDLATNSLLIHLVAAALWAGGLMALLAHALRRGGHADLAARRFSALALWCFVAMALSGVVNALVRIRLGDLLHSGYGWLVLAKATALCALGFIGWRHRRSGLVALRADPEARGPLIRLALVEALVFGLTFGIAVALGRTPPPAPPIFNPSIPAVEIGYDFAGPPTVARVLFDWRFDLIFGTAAIVMAVLYVLGVRRMRRRGDDWPMGRTLAWMCGCAVLLFTTSSGLGRYMPAMFSMHMVAHMLSVDAGADPAGLGRTDDTCPSDAAQRWARRAARTCGNGCWRRCIRGCRASSLTQSWPRCCSSRAFTACTSAAFSTPRSSNHAAHLLMNVHFLVSGYLFYWVVIGIDPTPRQIPQLAKVGDGFRDAAAARVLRRRADEHADRSRRELLSLATARLAYRSAGRSAAGRWNRLGGRRSPAHAGDDRPADPVATQRPTHCQTTRPGRRPQRRRGIGRLQRHAGRDGAP